MPATDPRVDAYVAKAAPFARPILKHLRRLVHESCPAAEETIKWGMPSFTAGGKILCGMAGFKAHCAVFFWHREVNALLAKDGLLDRKAMGSLGRIASLEDLPPERKLKGYLRLAAKVAGTEAPARARPARAKGAEAAVPDDLAAALRKNRAAARTFAAFSPSQRREYVAWIVGAKREETRRKRLATAIEWLSEGKKLNWRYERCEPAV